MGVMVTVLTLFRLTSTFYKSTAVWRKLKRVTEQLSSQNGTVYLRAGTWFAAYRQAG